MPASTDLPKWFTPFRMLCIFTCMSTLVFLDRGMIASTPVNGRRATEEHEGSGIQGAFDLSNFQDGCLPAAFMAGLLVSSPIFVHFSSTVEPFKLVGIGLLMWFASVFACGLSWDFWSLLICRTLVGVGEASFIILAAPFINSYAPPHKRSRWLSIFLMANPVGYAVGYIYGAVFGELLGWRGVFMSAACLMLPFAIFAFQTKPVPLGKDAIARRDAGGVGLEEADAPPLPPRTHDDIETTADAVALATPRVARWDAEKLGGLEADIEPPAAPRFGARKVDSWELDSSLDESILWEGEARLLEDGVPGEGASMRRQTLWLLRRPIFTLAVLGFTLHTALFGVLAYWGPKAITFMFRMHDGDADVIFGGITVATGIFGTLVGGNLLDATGGTGPRPRHAAARVCFLSVAIGAVFLQAAFAVGDSIPSFAVFFAFGELVLFLLQAPVTVLVLIEAPTHLQPLAFSIQTISIHVLGDVPSPPLAGLAHDYLFQRNDYEHPDSWRWTLLLVNCVLVGAIGLFLAALILTRNDGDLPDDGSLASSGGYAPIPAVHIPIDGPPMRRGPMMHVPVLNLDQVGFGMPMQPHSYPPPPLSPGGALGDPIQYLLDDDTGLSAVEEGGSSSASPTYRTASSLGSTYILSDTSGGDP